MGAIASLAACHVLWSSAIRCDRELYHNKLNLTVAAEVFLIRNAKFGGFPEDAHTKPTFRNDCLMRLVYNRADCVDRQALLLSHTPSKVLCKSTTM
jgi:hypothetical protein